jgi:hypothetical protein
LQINLSMLRCETIDTISGYVKGRMFAPDYQIKSILKYFVQSFSI